jgi:hypothetical protein
MGEPLGERQVVPVTAGNFPLRQAGKMQYSTNLREFCGLSLDTVALRFYIVSVIKISPMAGVRRAGVRDST